MSRLFCKLGFHNWELLGFTSLMLTDSLERCRDCGAGRLLTAYGAATFRYSPEQMKQMSEANPL